MSDLLSLKAVSRKYSNKSRGVIDLNFGIKPGERVALLGLNGAGKSTTFKLISGLLSPESGEINFNGLSMSRQLSAVRQQMGYLPEDIPLCRELTAYQHLKLQASHYCVEDERLDELIEICELQSVLERPIGNLSRGFRQRVALAGCLVHRPKLILLDEPTAGLDPHQVDQFRQLIKTLAKESALLLSTHILSEVEVMCDRCLILHEGKLVADEEIHSKSIHHWDLVCDIHGKQPDSSWEKIVVDAKISGNQYRKAISEDTDPSKELKKLIDDQVKVHSYTPQVDSLERKFLKITSGEAL